MKSRNFPTIDVAKVQIPESLGRLLPEELMKRYGIVPFDIQGSRLSVAMGDPSNATARSVVQGLTGCEIEPYAASPESLSLAIGRICGASTEVPHCRELNMASSGAETAIVQAVDKIFSLAVRHRASDIHIEPQANGVFLRFRVDGILRTIHMFPRGAHAPMVARVKIMATLDITEKRLPQDGQIVTKADGREIDLRVSTLPAKYGEKIVIRVLDKTSAAIDLSKVGMPEGLQSQFEILIDRPQGMLLVTGPTGSGKTTTLYAAIKRLRSPMRNIITLENPVEYDLMSESGDESGVTQVQVNPKVGLSFASGLRACLRQDPDVIMVGEIRDRETADVSMQAAMTGHLVFSTLHTNSAPETVARLRDIGADPWLIASTVTGIVSQRLLRRLCLNCRQAYNPPKKLLESLFPNKDLSKAGPLYRPGGCADCQGSGYHGRIGIFEMLTMTDELRHAIQNSEPLDGIARLAASQGMVSLRKSGLQVVYDGVTSMEEVFRNTVV